MRNSQIILPILGSNSQEICWGNSSREQHLSKPQCQGTAGSQALELRGFGNRQLVMCKHHPRALRVEAKQKSSAPLLLWSGKGLEMSGNLVLPLRCRYFLLPARQEALLMGLSLVLLRLNRAETTKLVQSSTLALPAHSQEYRMGSRRSRTFLLLHPRCPAGLQRSTSDSAEGSQARGSQGPSHTLCRQ